MLLDNDYPNNFIAKNIKIRINKIKYITNGNKLILFTNLIVKIALRFILVDQSESVVCEHQLKLNHEFDCENTKKILKNKKINI